MTNISDTTNLQPSFYIETLVVIGVGLIGGSLALDLKRLGLVGTVIGIDVDADNLQRAQERRIIDIAYSDMAQLANHQLDVVLIATPVVAMSAVLKALATVIQPKTIITDVGSTKQNTLSVFAEILPEHLAYCVAAHPISGSARSGALSAQFSLFADKKSIICAHEKQDQYALSLIKTMWQKVGAEVYELSAGEHDFIFAGVSHLPHLLSYAFMHQIASHQDKELFLQFAASGFRDFTRIAGSHPDIWADVCLANNLALKELLDDYLQHIEILKQLLHEENHQELRAYFNDAKSSRDEWESNQ